MLVVRVGLFSPGDQERDRVTATTERSRAAAKRSCPIYNIDWSKGFDKRTLFHTREIDDDVNNILPLARNQRLVTGKLAEGK